MEKQETNQTAASSEKTLIHAYVLWETGKILGFDMKSAAQKLGMGSTAFKTNMRNRFVCKLNIIEFSNKLNMALDNGCLTSINSENYNGTENNQTATKK
jgi:PBP1b-binding outer membrane lipoprotein LpoB